MKILSLCLITLLVTGCSQISTTETDREIVLLPGFDRVLTADEVVIDVEYVGFFLTHLTCTDHWYDTVILTASMIPILGCAEISSVKAEDEKYHCRIRMPYRWMTSVYEHEVDHCHGIGHAGTGAPMMEEQDDNK